LYSNSFAADLVHWQIKLQAQPRNSPRDKAFTNALEVKPTTASHLGPDSDFRSSIADWQMTENKFRTGRES
jgi:hypothetical protein